VHVVGKNWQHTITTESRELNQEVDLEKEMCGQKPKTKSFEDEGAK
jgi:hypothetical protein